MRTVHHATGGRLALLLAASGMCLAAGCAGRGQASDEGVNTGLANVGKTEPAAPVEIPDPPTGPAPGAELQRLAEESAASLQALFEQMNEAAEPETRAAATDQTQFETEPQEMQEPTAVGAALAEALRESGQAEMPPLEPVAAQMGPPAPVAEAPTPGPSPAEVAQAEASTEPAEPEADGDPKPPQRPLAQRIQETTLVLVDLLRQQAVAEPAPMKAYLSLAAMEVLRPGALQNIITPDPATGPPLTPDQTSAVETFRDFITSAAALADGTGNETDRLIAIADSLISSRPMRIRDAVLCARVTGFGQYIPLSSTRFLHGRNHPVIIYTEVAPFTYRPATSAEVSQAWGSTPMSDVQIWAVELSQEVQVYHDADGLLVWSRPEESITEVSRNKRRDFFLVNEIALPRTLSVGRYRMKVIMRDRTSGAVDEAILPFEVVADPALAAGPRE